MTHDVIASAASSERMSPHAVALAALLHALVALLLWWMAQHQWHLPPEEVPIEVTVEQPAPKPPPPVEKPQPKPPVPSTPQPKLGIPPPADITADRATQIPRPPQPRDVVPPPRETLEKEVPPPPEATPAPPSTAFAKPEPEPSPQPRPAQPPPGLRGTLPAPPAQKPAAPPAPRPAVRSAPHMIVPQRPPSTAPPSQPSSPFVNPADAYNRARASDNYLWEIVRKLAGYQYFAQVDVEEGTTVVRIVVARSGRLLDVSIAHSSGYPQLDKGVVEGIRAGSPYAPLPDNIQGDSATFTLPLVSRSHR